MTRQDFAGAVKYLCDKAGARLIAATTDPERNAGIRLSELTLEFYPQLEAAARWDADSFGRMNSIRSRYPADEELTPPGPHVLMADVVAATSGDRQPRPCAVLMFDHWAYDALQRLVDLGLMGSWWPDGTFRGNPAFTRGFIAENVLYVFDNGQGQLRSLSGPNGQAGRLDFCMLLQEFWPELRQMRPDDNFRAQVQEILRTYPKLPVIAPPTPPQPAPPAKPMPAAAPAAPAQGTVTTEAPVLPVAPPFADVPKGHWAFQAVEHLRQLGIMLGCPGSNGTWLFEG
jgi:hypothetical protein